MAAAVPTKCRPGTELSNQRVALSEEAAAIFDMPPDAEPSLQQVFAMLAPGSLPRALHNAIERKAVEDALYVEKERAVAADPGTDPVRAHRVMLACTVPG